MRCPCQKPFWIVDLRHHETQKMGERGTTELQTPFVGSFFALFGVPTTVDTASSVHHCCSCCPRSPRRGHFPRAASPQRFSAAVDGLFLFPSRLSVLRVGGHVHSGEGRAVWILRARPKRGLSDEERRSDGPAHAITGVHVLNDAGRHTGDFEPQ